MRFSIITVTKNSSRTIVRTLESVSRQVNVSVEHVIKDAFSSDNTVDLVKSVSPSALVVVKHDKGIYDAMNQGFDASTGDIIGFLNSDDYYADSDVLADIYSCFEENNCDFVYGDITMVSLTGDIVRLWTVGKIGDQGLVGQQIPHPGLFIRRDVIARLPIPFDPSYRISADLKHQLIIINKYKCKGVYINRLLTVMETGGESTNSFQSYLLGWKESVRAYNEVFGFGGFLFVFRKVLSKFKGLRVGSQFRHFGK